MNALESQIREGKVEFRDVINFPRGISRCGAFSIGQSNLLKCYGNTLMGLELGELLPLNSEEEDFILVCKGNKEAETPLEKAWQKYKSEICRSRSFHTLSGRKRSEEDSDTASFTDDTDEELPV